MITRVDAQLRREAEVHALRFGCEHCAHFVSEREVCANGYPVAAHLRIDLARVEELSFCKEFELR